MDSNTTSGGFPLYQGPGSHDFIFNADYQLPLDNFQFNAGSFNTLCIDCSFIVESGSINDSQTAKRRRLGDEPAYHNSLQEPGVTPDWSYQPPLNVPYDTVVGMAPTQPLDPSIMTPALAFVSPLAKKILDLGSLFCPCCGRQKQEGYYLVPDTQESLQYLDQPYMAEKLPAAAADFGNQTQNVSSALPLYSIAPSSEPPVHPNETFISYLNGTSSNHLPATQYMSQYTESPPYPGALMYAHSEPPLFPVGQQYNFAFPPYDEQFPSMPPNLSDASTEPSPANNTFHGPTPPNTQRTSPPGDTNSFTSGQMISGLDLVLVPDQRNGKRGPFRDPKLRLQTAQTRKIGSCVRCKMQRIRCDNNPDDPLGMCLTCDKVTCKKVGRFPCLRYKITDIQMFRPGQVPGYEWSRRWTHSLAQPIQHWASEETRTIRLSEGYSPKGVALTVRRFVPITGDKLERSWVYNGVKKSAKVPPFAVVDLAATKQAYQNYIQESMEDIITATMDDSSPLLKEIYTQIWKESNDESNSMELLSIVKISLCLWTTVRMTTRSTFIVGDDTLGMPMDLLDETSPTPGKIPLPPVMGAQLESILIRQILAKLRQELLDKFQRFILKNKAPNWFATFLVTAVLLHNTSLIIAHDAGYAVKHGINRRFAREEMVKEYHLGANILLAHFHYCNKGEYPFSENCSAMALQKLGNLTEEKVKAVQKMKTFIRMHETTWSQMWEGRQYENELFYVSQLFEEDWKPRDMSVSF